MSPACTPSTSNGSKVSSTICGRPYTAGVAPANTKSQRGVMTPTPNDKWLGLTRWTVMQAATDWLRSEQDDADTWWNGCMRDVRKKTASTSSRSCAIAPATGTREAEGTDHSRGP